MNARTRAVLALAVCAASAGSIACDAGAPEGPRNVVLITLDTTRADHLSCYGDAQKSTPRLDALAAEGTRFDLAIGTASVTPVAHAAILTGLYNHEHGLRVLYAEGGYRLAEEVETLATALAAKGVHTLAVHSAFPVSRFFGFERGFEVFEDLQSEMSESEGGYHWDVANQQRRSDETTDLALKRLGAEPFFLWVHYWDPHDLVQLPPGLKRPADDERAPKGSQPFYSEEVTYMDGQIGRLFDGLKERGLYDDTLIVVVADHGQGLGDHGWHAHRILYQEQIRVPLIVRVPGTKQVPVVPQVVSTVDIYPTVLDYLGLDSPRPVSGRSLRALIEGAPAEPRSAFADQINGYDWNAGMVHKRPLDDFLYAVVEGDWKLVYRPLHVDHSELFNLAKDPREERNLFSRRPEEARALLERLAAEAPWVTHFEPLASAEDRAEVRRVLDGLGYTGTEPVETVWAWTCPRHLDQRWEERGNCPSCGGPPLLIGR